MPVGPTRTKKQKQAVVHTEMHKFKHGTLHSGSKKGPVVTNPKQAVAIALSESGQSNKPPHATQPHPSTNPGCYDNEAHSRDVEGGYQRGGQEFRPGSEQAAREAVERTEENLKWAQGMQPVLPMQHGSMAKAHTFGHGSQQRSGALRLSGHRNAHRIGAK